MMELKFLAKTSPTYYGMSGSFQGSGTVREVSQEAGNYLLENYPDDFEVVSDDSSSDSSEEESSSDDEDSSEDRETILTILSDGSTLKITEIAEKMGVSWQSIRSEVGGLVADGKISKNADGQYQVV